MQLGALIARLDTFDLAIFISANAVDKALALVRERRAWPPALRVATVGRGSERELRRHGFAAVIAPADLLLVETDAPFLTPTPYRGRPNAPYLIPLTMRTLAEVRGDALDELCADVAANWHRAFGIAPVAVSGVG